MQSKNTHVLKLFKRGIVTFADVMEIAEFLDDPANAELTSYAEACAYMHQWIGECIDPEHYQHGLLMDTLWRSYRLQEIHDKVLKEIEPLFEEDYLEEDTLSCFAFATY